MKKIIYFLFIAMMSTFIMSCNNDDNNSEISQEDQDYADDEAIIQFLKNYYFDSYGKIKVFSSSDNSDDGYASLYSLAVKDPSGFWYVKNPAVTATGAQPTGTNTIYLNYDMQYFNATLDDNRQVSYTVINNLTGSSSYILSSINTTGYPVKNPFFYKRPADLSSAYDIYSDSFFVMEGIRDGLMKFNATGSSIDQTYSKLQGVIVAPSRLCYNREVYNILGTNFFRNSTIILNFELCQVSN